MVCVPQTMVQSKERGVIINVLCATDHGDRDSKLTQLLFKNDLVDELCIKIYPLTLGEGKKLFDKGTMPAAFTLTEGTITPKGMIIANYKRAGEVKTGIVGE